MKQKNFSSFHRQRGVLQAQVPKAECNQCESRLNLPICVQKAQSVHVCKARRIRHKSVRKSLDPPCFRFRFRPHLASVQVSEIQAASRQLCNALAQLAGYFDRHTGICFIKIHRRHPTHFGFWSAQVLLRGGQQGRPSPLAPDKCYSPYTPTICVLQVQFVCCISSCQIFQH